MIPILLLVVLSYLFPVIFLKKDVMWQMVPAIFIISVYHGISFLNAYYFRTPGAGIDALFFHENALKLVTSGKMEIDTWVDFYTAALACVYLFSGVQDIFIGQACSVCAVSCTIVFFVKFFELIHTQRRPFFSILALFLLPSMVLICSITLRESFEILFFMMALYFLALYCYERKMIWLSICGGSGLCLGLLHPALSALGVFVCIPVLLELLKIPMKLVIGWVAKFRVLILIIIVMGAIFIPQKYHNKEAQYAGCEETIITTLLRGNIIPCLKVKRDLSWSVAHKARATYFVPLQFDSSLLFMNSIIKIVSFYFAAPFPWQIQNVLDSYAFLENIWRLALIVLALQFIKQQNQNRYVLIFIFSSYLFISFLWAIGTVNYGTALRHHLVGYWILVLFGVPFLESGFKNSLKRCRN